MLRFLHRLCHRPAIRLGLGRDARGRYRNTQFASFLASSNRGRNEIDLHGAILRGRKFVRHGLTLLLAGGAAWIAVESAQALSIF